MPDLSTTEGLTEYVKVCPELILWSLIDSGTVGFGMQETGRAADRTGSIPIPCFIAKHIK